MIRRREVGYASDSVRVVGRKHRPDYQIVLYAGLLMIVGLIVLYSISPARTELINANSGASLDTIHFMEKQLLNLGIGLVAFVVASLVPLSFWKKNASKLLLGGLAACLLLALLGLVMDDGLILKAGGATRWFRLGGVTSFQPAELLKFGILIFSAVFLAKRMKEDRVNDLNATLMPLGLVAAAAGFFIIVLQKDMGTGLTLIGMLAAILYAAGLNRRWLSTAAIAAVSVGILLIITSPHRVERVLTFFNPSAVDSSSYHITQALIALGSGGLFGKGLGQGVQAFGYLPEAINDSIFAILGETFGFVGVVVIIILFWALLGRIMKVLRGTLDPTAQLVVAGVYGLIAVHVIVNIGAMTGIFPLTGVTLPFLSFGGTSLLFTMLSLGIVFAISRYTTHQEVKLEEGGRQHETTLRRRRVGRTRYASSSRYQ